MNFDWKQHILSYDSRKDIIIADQIKQSSMIFCVEHFISVANEAIESHGKFCVALSGGTTPKELFTLLASDRYRTQIDWSKVQLFWSDERCVLPTDPESNYKMAMDAGLKSLPILPENIYRMPAEYDNFEALEKSARAYEELIDQKLFDKIFDMVMLGMGEDGHTASLFPETHGLRASDRNVIANFIPKKNVWRMTLTYKCINQARLIVIYVFGKGKASMVREVFNAPFHPDQLPIQNIGTQANKALWILDEASSRLIRPLA